MHFAGSVVVPESVAKPLRYYLNNTAKSRTLIEAAVQGGVKNFVFSSTAAVYGPDVEQPVVEGAETAPVTPYGRSKLMTETMLADTAAAHGLRYAALRYFNVAGSDPDLRTGHSTKGATHLLKVVVEAALGKRAGVDVFGTDWDTPDGTGVRDFIHVSDLTRAHVAALAYLRNGGRIIVANCGYGRGYSVRQVIDAVERLSGRSFQVRNAPRRTGDLGLVVSDPSLLRATFDWAPRHDDLDFIVRTALAWEEQLGKRR
jgi:UDP-glucose 4-epimerase